jgi:phage-related tail protein
MNAESLILRAKEAADKLYYEGISLDKLNFHRGYLESTIRELVVQLNNTQELLSYATDEIKSLKDELRNLRND